jgi:hypothetical protein
LKRKSPGSRSVIKTGTSDPSLGDRPDTRFMTNTFVLRLLRRYRVGVMFIASSPQMIYSNKSSQQIRKYHHYVALGPDHRVIYAPFLFIFSIRWQLPPLNLTMLIAKFTRTHGMPPRPFWPRPSSDTSFRSTVRIACSPAREALLFP